MKHSPLPGQIVRPLPLLLVPLLALACAAELEHPELYMDQTGGGSAGAAGTGGTGGGGGGTAGTGGTSGSGGTGGSGGTSGSAGAAACDAVTTLFLVVATQTEAGCDGTICHHAGTGFLPDLVTPNQASRLLDVPAAATGSCPGEVYIDTANIENSLMLKKLTATPGCGVQMPFALPEATLTPEEVECLRSWIASVVP